MEPKIKTNHPFTTKQLAKLNEELKKISNYQIVGLKGMTIPGKNNFAEIKLLKSPYILDVFLSFLDHTNPEQPKYFLYKIDAAGIVDYLPRQTMIFNSLADRITFFNELEPITFTY